MFPNKSESISSLKRLTIFAIVFVSFLFIIVFSFQIFEIKKLNQIAIGMHDFNTVIDDQNKRIKELESQNFVLNSNVSDCEDKAFMCGKLFAVLNNKINKRK